jgi:hypothetical protein
MSCPPDTDAKRLCRFYLYRRIKNLWAAGGSPEGAAVVLAGAEASEIGCLRDYLEFKPDNVYFVDKTEDEGLALARQQWSRVRTFSGNITDAVETLRSDIAILNLDFCGHMTQTVLDSVRAAEGKISLKGVVAYTFVADRENGVTPNWASVQEIALELMEKDPRFRNMDRNSQEWRDAVRFMGYSGALKSILGNEFEPIFAVRYHVSRTMGVVALQRIPRHLRTPRWRQEHALYRSGDERNGSIPDIALRTKLRDIALELSDTIPSKKVADILHLPRTVMGAWQANKTRGAYTGD